MMSECVDCDATAVAYHGRFAYCERHLAQKRGSYPDLHTCRHCGEPQPLHMSWHRDRPCDACDVASFPHDRPTTRSLDV